MGRDYGNPKSRLENSELENRIAHMISSLKERFWIPKGRAEVKTVFNKYMGSKRWRTRSFKLPTMTNYIEVQ
ncbi:hypothetical protein WUBG_11406, partial [Wuchereria bancrofti]